MSRLLLPVGATDNCRNCDQSYSTVMFYLMKFMFMTVIAHILVATIANSVVDATMASSASDRDRSLSNSYPVHGKV